MSENPGLVDLVSKFMVLCAFKYMNFFHGSHKVLSTRENSIVITRTSSVLSNPETKEAYGHLH